MEKRKHSERESRRRKERPGYKTKDHHSGLRTRAKHCTVTSGAQANDRGMRIGKCEDLPGPPVSGSYQPGDYVQRWLAQTTQELDVPLNSALECMKQNVTCSIGPEGPSGAFNFESFLQVKEQGENKERSGARYKSRKRIRDSSSDCSFLEPRVASEPNVESNEAWKVCERTEIQAISKSHRVRQNIKPQVLLKDGSVSLSTTPPAEVFEKRRRHKTREDRYEPRKVPKESKIQVIKDRKRDKGGKMKTRSKVIRNVGEDLMHQFSSKSVGHDRLTMHPSHTPGLFNNGRASFPGKWRGLPDLAFSEMEFLRRSKQGPIEVEEKSWSKSREKEKRKAERAQNEISEYFKPGTSLRTETEINKNSGKQPTPYVDEGSPRLPQEGLLKDKYQSNYSKSTSTSIDLSEEPPAISCRGETLEQITAMPRSGGQVVHPRVAPDSRQELSGRETTYFTWSDSIRSPDIPKSKQKRCSAASTTPESIRRLLDNTGVFADTGIDRTTGRRHHPDHKEPVRSEIPASSRKLSALLECTSPNPRTHRPSLEPSLERPQAYQTIQAVEIITRGLHSSPKARKSHLHVKGRKHTDDGELPRPPGAIIKRYSPESGWQPHTTYEGPMIQPFLSKTDASNQRISRQAIAQAAYVKRALPTDAAVREAHHANMAALSTDAAAEDTKTSRKQQIEQATQTDSSAEISYNSPSLRSGQAEGPAPEADEARPLVAQPNIGHHSQSPKSLISDLPASSKLDALPRVDHTPGASLTEQAIPSLSDIRYQADACTQRATGPDTIWHSHVAVDAHSFEGLSVRGSWQSRTSGLESLPRIITPIAVIKPLYSHQLGDRISYDTTEPSNIQTLPQDYVLSHLDTHFMQHSHNEEAESFDAYEGEEELINDSASIQGFEATFWQAFDPDIYVIEGEEQPTEWEIRHLDVLHQAAGQEIFCEGAQYRVPLDQHQVPVVNANIHESHYYHNMYEPSRSSVREHGAEEPHGLSGFWQPYRHY